MNPLHKLYIILLLLFLFPACSPQQEPISYGTDSCHHCKMTISDNRYGSQIVTKKGKVYKFDSIECVAKYMHENTNTDAHMLLVTDYKNPGQLIEANKAFFLQSTQMPSPMGMNLTALSDGETARQLAGEKDGEVVNWETVQKICVNHGHGNH